MRKLLHHPAVLPPIRSPRAQEIARWFELSHQSRSHVQCRKPLDQIQITSLLPAPGSISLVLGPSGSGKSSLLRALKHATPSAEWIDVNALQLPDLPVVDCICEREISLTDALRALCAVGLAEVWTWLRKPTELSDGQRWRLKLACALHTVDAPEGSILCCDEFAAGLDRITARVVGRTFRRSVISPRRAVVATSDQDLLGALKPQIVARCDFGIIHIQQMGSAQEQE